MVGIESYSQGAVDASPINKPKKQQTVHRQETSRCPRQSPPPNTPVALHPHLVRDVMQGCARHAEKLVHVQQTRERFTDSVALAELHGQRQVSARPLQQSGHQRPLVFSLHLVAVCSGESAENFVIFGTPTISNTVVLPYNQYKVPNICKWTGSFKFSK